MQTVSSPEGNRLKKPSSAAEVATWLRLMDSGFLSLLWFGGWPRSKFGQRRKWWVVLSPLKSGLYQNIMISIYIYIHNNTYLYINNISHYHNTKSWYPKPIWLTEMYPLVICYIAIENDHWNSGCSHWKWWFSIARNCCGIPVAECCWRSPGLTKKNAGMVPSSSRLKRRISNGFKSSFGPAIYPVESPSLMEYCIIYIYIYIHTYVCMHACVYVYTIYIYTYIHIYIYTYIHIYIYTYIHIYIYTYIHIIYIYIMGYEWDIHWTIPWVATKKTHPRLSARWSKEVDWLEQLEPGWLA